MWWLRTTPHFYSAELWIVVVPDNDLIHLDIQLHCMLTLQRLLSRREKIPSKPSTRRFSLAKSQSCCDQRIVFWAVSLIVIWLNWTNVHSTLAVISSSMDLKRFWLLRKRWQQILVFYLFIWHLWRFIQDRQIWNIFLLDNGKILYMWWYIVRKIPIVLWSAYCLLNNNNVTSYITYRLLKCLKICASLSENQTELES